MNGEAYDRTLRYDIQSKKKTGEPEFLIQSYVVLKSVTIFKISFFFSSKHVIGQTSFLHGSLIFIW